MPWQCLQNVIEPNSKSLFLYNPCFSYLFSEKITNNDFKKQLVALVENLNTLPHIYYPHRRVESTQTVVQNWLNTKTSSAEPELCGFTSHDPYEPRKFIPNCASRKSNSEINISLMNRKKGVEIYSDISDIIDVYKSSSDTRVSCHAAWNKPCKGKRRRNVVETQKRKRRAVEYSDTDVGKRRKING